VGKKSFSHKEPIRVQYFKTAYGEIILGSFRGSLCLADWRYRKMRVSIDRRITTVLDAGFVEESSAVIEETKLQLTQYFRAERKSFDIPILLVGTDFQKKVWNELLKIPYGETESYLGLSKKLNNVKAIRAVASANGANAISILVPCHRIVGSNGKLVGYAGGLKTKKKLLELEGSLIANQLELF